MTRAGPAVKLDLAKNFSPVVNNPKPRWSVNPLFVDLGLTGATGFAVLVASLVVVSLFGKVVGTVALGEYLLLRRVYSWLQSASLLGLAGGLPRYVAHAVAKPRTERLGYLFAALICGSAITLCLAAILWSGRTRFAQWWFGSAQMKHLMLPLTLLLVGGSAHALAFGYFRGRLAMKRANTLQALNLGVIPILAVLTFEHRASAALIVDVTAIAMTICSLIFLAPLLPQLLEIGWAHFRRHSVELLRYGVPRLPAAFGLGALFALGPMIAAHYLPLIQVTYLLVGMSLLMGVSASAEPLGLILLSKMSMVLAQDRVREVRTPLSYLQAAVLETYFFICLQLIVFADVLVRAWVGPKLLSGIVVMRVCLLAVPVYLMFVALRSIVDAASVTPHNTYNIVISSVVFLSLVAAGVGLAPRYRLPESVAAAMVVSLMVLAWLTQRTVRRLYDFQMEWGRSAVPLMLGVVLGGTSLLFHWAQGFQTGLVQFVLLELITFGVFFALLKQLGSPWLPFFWNWAFPRQAEGKIVAAEQRG